MSKVQKSKPVRSTNHLILAGRKNAAHATRREKSERKYPKAWRNGGGE